MVLNRVILLLACVAFDHCNALESGDVVERALRAIDNDFAETWAFTETAVTDDKVHVATFDPRRPQHKRWMLVSIDQRPPSDDERAAFMQEKAKLREQAEAESTKADEASGLDATIQPGSLRLIEETDDHWLFGFTPAADAGDEDFMQHVDGRLRIVKDGEYLESLSLESKSPFKPTAGVKISRFETRLTFGPAGDAGPVVPRSVDVNVTGRAFLAIRIDERESVQYSDYDYVGRAQELVPDR